MPGLKSIFSKEVKGNIKIPNHPGTICITRKKAAHKFQTKNNLEKVSLGCQVGTAMEMTENPSQWRPHFSAGKSMYIQKGGKAVEAKPLKSLRI